LKSPLDGVTLQGVFISHFLQFTQGLIGSHAIICHDAQVATAHEIVAVFASANLYKLLGHFELLFCFAMYQL
jgi:hypothetical protein